MRASRRAVLCATALVFTVVPAPSPAADTAGDEDLMRKIEAARTRADHQEIARIYEQRAKADLAAAEEHRRARDYYEEADQSAGGRSTISSTMATHCDNLVEAYTRSAEQNSALARLHREVVPAD